MGVKKITSSHAVVRLDKKYLKNDTNFNIRANVEVKYNKLLNFLVQGQRFLILTCQTI